MDDTRAIRVAFTGDSILTRRITGYRDEPTRQLYDLIRDADVAFTNLEVLVNDFRGYPAVECGGTHFGAGAWVLDELMEIGFDLFACATNHSLDYSIAGVLANLVTLRARGATFAGIGENLAEARMPAYIDHDRGSVAMLSCSSTFGPGQYAGEQRPDMQGRPGLNPLRVETTYEVSASQLDALRSIALDLGIEQERQQVIQMGFKFPPASPDIFPFLDGNFREGSRAAIRTAPKSADMEAISTWTQEARRRADTVIVSIHSHEQGGTKEEPAEFLRTFAHRVIDEGADVVVGHGPHLLRGMELYRGKPIFYSLGNFIGQNELVERLPADSYERFRVDPAATPGQIFESRSQNDTKSFPADVRFWQTVMPLCDFADGQVTRIELVPVTLGHGQRPHRRGRPRLAAGTEATEILTRFADLSTPFGTNIACDGDRGVVQLPHREDGSEGERSDHPRGDREEAVVS